MTTKISVPAGRNASRAMAALGPELVEQVNQIQNLLNRVHQGAIVARYEIGEIIAKVMDDEAKYGDKAIDSMATALSLDPQELYLSRQLTLCYDKKELQSILKLKVAGSGVSISWSHLVLLCRVPKDGMRVKLQEKVFKQGLTVRELAAEIQRLLGKRGGAKGRPRVGLKTPGGALAALSSRAQNDAMLISDALPQLEKVLAEPSKFGTENFVEEVKEALDQIRTTRSVYDTLVVKLESVEAGTAKSLRLKKNQAEIDKQSPKATKRAAAATVLGTHGNGNGKVKVKIPVSPAKTKIVVKSKRPTAAVS